MSTSVGRILHGFFSGDAVCFALQWAVIPTISCACQNSDIMAENISCGLELSCSSMWGIISYHASWV
jgi:hypothetical protein